MDMFLENIEDDIDIRGYTYINSEFMNTYLEDVKVLNIKNLYASIAVYLYKRNILNIDDTLIKTINRVSNFLDNSDTIKLNDNEQYKLELIFANKFYFILYQLYRSELKKCSCYLRNLLNYLIEVNKNSIIYIDTDIIYYKGDLNIESLNLKYELSNIDVIYIFSMKKFISINNSEIKVKGFSDKSKATLENNIMKIKMINRNRKLKKVLKYEL